jgi:hypothetical protein
MSARPLYATYTIGTEAVSLETILGKSYPATVVVRASQDNAGVVFWGPATVTATSTQRGGFLLNGDSATVDVVGHLGADKIYFVSTVTNDVCFFTGVE